MPIDFYRCKKNKKKLSFKEGEWLSYPVNIERYLCNYSGKRFTQCNVITEISDIGDTLLSCDEILEIIKFCKFAINEIKMWTFSGDIYLELKEYKLKKQDLLLFFENLYRFFTTAKNENENVYCIGE